MHARHGGMESRAVGIMNDDGPITSGAASMPKHKAAQDHERHRQNRQIGCFGRKPARYRDPATNRRRVGDAGPWGKSQNNDYQPMLPTIGRRLSFTWGLSPQTPGIYRFGATMARLGIGRPQQHPASRWSAPNRRPPYARRDGPIPAPPLPRLSRRSGRIPAEPYPPLSCDQYRRMNMSPSRKIQ